MGHASWFNSFILSNLIYVCSFILFILGCPVNNAGLRTKNSILKHKYCIRFYNLNLEKAFDTLTGRFENF